MRTTISIPDDLLAQTKEFAARSGRSLSAVIEDALREVLSRRTTSVRRKIKLTTRGGRGVLPGVDLDNNASLLAYVEQLRGEHASG